MVKLKKIKASTLMETLMATVIIVVVFMVASMILNNLFSNSIKNNMRSVDAYLTELEYLYQNEKIKVPYHDDFKLWSITMESAKSQDLNSVVLKAVNTKTNKTRTKHIAN